MTNQDLKPLTFIAIALSLSCVVGCSRRDTSSVEASSTAPSSNAAAAQNAGSQKVEPESNETQSVEPEVQSEIERMEAQKRASLLKDAQSALEDTRSALMALDKGDKNTALAALEQASGKLELVVSRDPKLALAPVDVNTTISDLYATPDTVKRVIKDVKDDLSSNQVQDARYLLSDLASEADIHAVDLPLATYPAAIKAIAPLIDAGKAEEARAALEEALNTLVIETYIIPLPRVRAEALLQRAEQLTTKSNRTQEDKQKIRSLLDATRTQIQLAEALGYGTKDDYKPLYAQLDDVQKKAENGQPGQNLFDRLQQSLKRFKFVS